MNHIIFKNPSYLRKHRNHRKKNTAGSITLPGFQNILWRYSNQNSNVLDRNTYKHGKQNESPEMPSSQLIFDKKAKITQLEK